MKTKIKKITFSKKKEKILKKIRTRYYSIQPIQLIEKDILKKIIIIIIIIIIQKEVG